MILDNAYFLAVAKDLTPFAVAALTWGIGSLANLLLKHTHNAVLQAAISEGKSLMEDLVQSLNQSTVNFEKLAGTWTAATGEAVKAKALAQWKLQVATSTKKVLTHVVPDLEGRLMTWLEKAVAEAPNRVNVPAKPVNGLTKTA